MKRNDRIPLLWNRPEMAPVNGGVSEAAESPKDWTSADGQLTTFIVS